MERYKEHVLKFSKLMEELKKLFSDKEIKEVQDFLDFAEYGLALDTVVGIFIENKKTITPEAITMIKGLASMIGADPIIYESKEVKDLLKIE